MGMRRPECSRQRCAGIAEEVHSKAGGKETVAQVRESGKDSAEPKNCMSDAKSDFFHLSSEFLG